LPELNLDQGETQMAIISGTLLSDVIDGTNVNDIIYGYPAFGYGSGENDYDGFDTLYGYAGDDVLYGGNQDDILYGGSGNDGLYGQRGNDNLYGGTGNDSLYGGDGNDLLDGYGVTGIEYDTLVGGGGSDTFVLGGSWGVSYQGFGFATITDWNPLSDFIKTVGNSSQYSLGYSDLSGGSDLDTQIYYGVELIANVQDTTNVIVSLDFIFA
jgi:Ca2+-binding RTX toxin-like protein